MQSNFMSGAIYGKTGVIITVTGTNFPFLRDGSPFTLQGQVNRFNGRWVTTVDH
jgi:hypothetical protein